MTKTKRSRRLGQTMMEFVLIICLVAAAVSGTVYFFGDKIKEAFNVAIEVIANATGIGKDGGSGIGNNPDTTQDPTTNRQ